MTRSRLLGLTAPGMLIAAAGAPIALGSAGPPATAAKTNVSVRATEFRFQLRPASARRGRVTFRVRNAGRIPHDFRIARRTTRLLRPGARTTLTVRLRRGSYRYICTVPGHADSGMKGSFRVR